MAQRFRALEYVATGGSWSKAKHLELAQVDGVTSLTPGLRGDMHRQARRDQQWTGRPSSWGSREQDQKPNRQGAKGAAKGGPLVEVARREPVRERTQKGKQDLGEHRTGSWQQRVAGWEETQTGVGTKSRQWRVFGCLRSVVGFATFSRKVLFLSTVSSNLEHCYFFKQCVESFCKEYTSKYRKFYAKGYEENDNNNNMSDETKCETNYSIDNKWNNMRNKHHTKHDTNDDVDLDNCVVHTVR